MAGVEEAREIEGEQVAAVDERDESTAPAVPEDENVNESAQNQEEGGQTLQEGIENEEKGTTSDVAPAEVTTEGVQDQEPETRVDDEIKSATPTQTEEISTEEAEHQPGDGENPSGEGVQVEVASRDELFEEDQGPIVSVGEPLSRTTSQVAVEDGGGATSLKVPSIRPSTPEKSTPIEEADQNVQIVEGIVEESEESPALIVDRDQLSSQYQEALLEREKLLGQNNQLQHRLADYFRRKKTDERQEVEKSVTDQEQRYVKCMGALEEHELELSDIQQQYEDQLADLKERREDKQTRVEAAAAEFQKFKHDEATAAVNTRSGKPLLEKDIDVYEAQEAKKVQEVITVRLENIKLKNKLKKKEMQLKQKEELAEGLHLIDFEQLKIENQTYNEKIEERNEELLKLRKKITSTVQVLTHVKEKLQFVQGENSDLQKDLDRVDSLVADKRDLLSRTKQARDGLRNDNIRLRGKCGLLGQESLLRDFEDRRDESEQLKSRLSELKMLHTQLTLDCDGLRQKIEQAKHAKLF